MIHRMLTGLLLCAGAACASSSGERHQHHDYGADAAAEAERIRDRTNTHAAPSANDNSPINQGYDAVRDRSSENAQDPK